MGVDAITGWFEENWDVDLTVGEWWERLADAGWASPMLPSVWFGHGCSRDEAIAVARALDAAGATGPPRGIGLGLVAPTIVEHGTEMQKHRYLRDIVTGRTAWCQLFSEPGAGSDLAGLTTNARKDGDEWIVNGQKVWTSDAAFADFGILLARTDSGVPKHQGITYFAIDMHQPGVEVRPLREITGRALFNEVFLTDARVRDDDVIGDVNNGWAVARATLAIERAAQSAGAAEGSGLGGGVFPPPGTKANVLDRPVSEFLHAADGAGINPLRVSGELLAELARAEGKDRDRLLRQDLARLHILDTVARWTALRARTLDGLGADTRGFANMGKLAESRLSRLRRDLSARILGPAAMLHAYCDEDRAVLDRATGRPELAAVTYWMMFAPVSSIAGGTDEIQHNVIGERALDLPREPGIDRVVPFRELPRNA